MIWFTSDQHFYHKNVIRYCNRPFKSLEEMHETLIQNWNKVVGPTDIVYILGDFAFCGVARMKEIVSRLNGCKLFVQGNHDPKPSTLNKAGFDIILEPTGTLPLYRRKIAYSHYPYAPTRWEHFVYKLKTFWKFWRKKNSGMLRYIDRRPIDNGQWLLHGHVHGAWKVKRRMINVGVDQWGFTPVSAEQIEELILEKETPL